MTTDPPRPTLATLLSVAPEDLDWLPMGPGVDRATVLKDPDRGYSVMFLRFEPGAAAVRHRHPEGEQYFVISGSIVDETGRHGAGRFVNLPPGSEHEPRSPEGALVLVTWFGRLESRGSD